MMEVAESEFDFGRQLVPCPSLPWADELFHDGVIRPLTKQDGFEVASLGRARDPAPRNPPLFPLRASEFGPHHPSSSMGGLKWRLKDLLLYRSASEGRPLKSYSYSVSPLLMGWKSSAFRPPFNGEASSSRRHYHRADSEQQQLKNKKTSLSYNRRFLSCMGFNSSSSSSRHHRKLSCFF